jgi:ElaB/YqjD/DUF883 family membrane-anchored ribosome-binding protein
MMQQAAQDFDRARGKMAGDFRTMIADGEELLKAAASVSGEGFAAARTRFEQKLTSAKASLAEASQPAIDRAKEGAAVADRYVRGNPWSAVGIAIAVGAVLGFLAARR